MGTLGTLGVCAAVLAVFGAIGDIDTDNNWVVDVVVEVDLVDDGIFDRLFVCVCGVSTIYYLQSIKNVFNFFILF